MEQHPLFNYDQPNDNQQPPVDRIHEAVMHLLDLVQPVIDQAIHLEHLSYRTPDEEEQLKEMRQLLQKVLPVVSRVKNYFGEKAFKQAQAYYYHVKELADEGDSEAKKIYDDLRPLYEDIIRDQITDN